MGVTKKYTRDRHDCKPKTIVSFLRDKAKFYLYIKSKCVIMQVPNARTKKKIGKFSGDVIIFNSKTGPFVLLSPC